MKKIFPIIFIFFVSLIFFKDLIVSHKLPIPADTIVGLYNPYRDLYAKNYPNGIPFKNFLITDPVRQTYPWRFLAINLEKQLKLPLWNPYNFAGSPLLANFQSAPFYPFNIIFFILPFSFSWSILIYLQILLSGIFMYFYLRSLNLNSYASILGSLVFSFCGFSIAWLEWNTVIQTILWLPLILLTKDRLISKWSLKWSLVLFFAETASILAGHLQVMFYILCLTNIYLFVRIFEKIRLECKENYFKNYFKIYLPFFVISILIFAITFIQWFPTLQFINLSSRSIDQSWRQIGWFIPYQNLIQFIIPDFFGNPVTLNYFGIWNYAEFIGYIGILPLIFAIFAIFFRHDKKTYFWTLILFISLAFSLSNFISKLPFELSLPFISEAQPTRLLSLIDFSLAVLSAFGFDYFIRTKSKKIFFILIILLVIFGLSYLIGINKINFGILYQNLLIIKRNIVFPFFIFVISLVILGSYIIFSKNKYINNSLLLAMILIVSVDLLRFGFKFIPFTPLSYLYPQTKTISFLQKNLGYFRYMTTSSQIMPPNFSVIYKLQTVDGYDPLYLNNYAQLIIANERNKPNINMPYGFNRIITPKNFNNKIINLLGVKYVLSLTNINNPNFKKVYEEGSTLVYKNENYLPRAFFVSKTINVLSNNSAINEMYKSTFSPLLEAAVNDFKNKQFIVGNVKIINYQVDQVIIKTQSSGSGFLILTDSFYPTWRAFIGKKEVKIYQTDLNFRGIIVPKGNHTVIFIDNLF